MSNGPIDFSALAALRPEAKDVLARVHRIRKAWSCQSRALTIRVL